MSNNKASEKNEYKVRCHCGRMEGTFECDMQNIVAWDCNCSDCMMRGNTHIIIPESDFRLDMKESLEETSILYLWGTKNAKRHFCKTCGILPWYRPRSNPDGYGITLNCIDWGEMKPEIEVRKFDGQNWEECFSNSNIADQSKK